MSSTIGAIGQQGQQNATGYDAFREVDLNDFIKLMVAELQHQDPLNPMDNAQILEQMSQIRSIASNDKLTETLDAVLKGQDAVLLGQNMATASRMIDQWITTDLEGQNPVAGRVERVSIEDGAATLHIGDDVTDLKNVWQILPEALGIDVAKATGMLGQTIRVRTDGTVLRPSREIVGVVDRVSIEDGLAKLHLGSHTVGLDNVVRVLLDKDGNPVPDDTQADNG